MEEVFHFPELNDEESNKKLNEIKEALETKKKGVNDIILSTLSEKSQ